MGWTVFNTKATRGCHLIAAGMFEADPHAALLELQIHFSLIRPVVHAADFDIVK